MSSKKQILFFIGEDITAHLIMNKVITDIMLRDVYEPVLFFPKNTKLKNADLPQLREFSFFDKTLLNHVVYPFIEQQSSPCAKNFSPSQLAERYNLHVEMVDDVNDPSFVARLGAKDDIACAISIRCTQLFKQPITEAIKRTAPFVNLHSGLLPDYRGVMPTLRRMFDIARGVADDADYGCTLHKVDHYDSNALHKGIDTGKIIEVKSIKLNPAHSGYQANVGLVEAGADALISTILQIQNEYTLRGYPQNQEQSAYYTFPTQQELAEWKGAGIVLVRPEDALVTLVNAFSKANTAHGKSLSEAIGAATMAWYKQNCGCYESMDSLALVNDPCADCLEVITNSQFPAGQGILGAPSVRVA
jgi:methionyl-tRNA formyltransferase